MQEDYPSSSRFRDNQKYKMNSRRRGVALIINHSKFEVPGLSNRVTTAADGQKLTGCFEKLGFEVRTMMDKKFSKIKKRLHKVSKEDLSQCDCLVIVVLSHGNYGTIFAKDQEYKEEELWKPFTAENCRTLEGKPKLYFIQTCRGDKYDPGVTLMPVKSSRVFQPDYEVDDNFVASFAALSTKEPQSYLLQLEPHFLVAHASVPDYCAWRSATGAWFIHELCSELSDKPKDHLLSILQRVGCKVAVDYESNTDDPTSNGKKQMPCITHTLDKLVFFD